jgi:hypothetical protein
MGTTTTNYFCLSACEEVALTISYINCCSTDFCNNGTSTVIGGLDDYANLVTTRLNIPLIIGLSVGGFCFLLIVVSIGISILIYCFCCRKSTLKSCNLADQKPKPHEISSITQNTPFSLPSKYEQNANRRYSSSSSSSFSPSIYSDQAQVKIVIVHPYSLPRTLVM